MRIFIDTLYKQKMAKDQTLDDGEGNSDEDGNVSDQDEEEGADNDDDDGFFMPSKIDKKGKEEPELVDDANGHNEEETKSSKRKGAPLGAIGAHKIKRVK